MSVRGAAGVKKGRQTKDMQLFEAKLYCTLSLLLLPIARRNITRDPPDCKCVMGDVMVGGCLGHSDHEMVEFKIFGVMRKKGQQSCYPGFEESKLQAIQGAT